MRAYCVDAIIPLYSYHFLLSSVSGAVAALGLLHGGMLSRLVLLRRWHGFRARRVPVRRLRQACLLVFEAMLPHDFLSCLVFRRFWLVDFATQAGTGFMNTQGLTNSRGGYVRVGHFGLRYYRSCCATANALNCSVCCSSRRWAWRFSPSGNHFCGGCCMRLPSHSVLR